MILTVSFNPAMDVDLVIEKFLWEDRNPVLAEKRDPGGKGINVSRVVQELGGRTVAVTTAGGRVGEELLERLREKKIVVQAVQIQGETRANYAVSQGDGDRSIRLNLRGPKLTAREVRSVFAEVERALPQAEVLVLSGSLPRGVADDTYARLIRRARKLGVPTALDADGKVLRHGLESCPWLIKPNRFEAERLLGRTIRGEQGARKAAVEMLEKFGVEIVFLSLGKEGAIIAARNRDPNAARNRLPVSGDVLLRATLPPVVVRSAIGAGDSALAAFLWRWHQSKSDQINAIGIAFKWSFRERVRDGLVWAMAAGVACAMTPATELCHRSDVQRLVKRVKVLDCSHDLH